MNISLLSRPTVLTFPRASSARGDQLVGTAPETLAEYAGRICYDSLGGTGRSSSEYAAHILDVGHGSVLEHAQFSFLIEGVSRNFSHEIVRHRVGVAISQRSTRYCDESASDVIPHPLAGIANTRGIHDLVEDSRAIYSQVNDSLVAAGVPRKRARAAAARYLLSGLSTTLVWSANVRTLRHVITLRGSEAADDEARVFAARIWAIMAIEAPEYFRDFTIHYDEFGIPYVKASVNDKEF